MGDETKFSCKSTIFIESSLILVSSQVQSWLVAGYVFRFKFLYRIYLLHRIFFLFEENIPKFFKKKKKLWAL